MFLKYVFKQMSTLKIYSKSITNGIDANINNFNNIYIIFHMKNFSSCTFEIKKLISLKG